MNKLNENQKEQENALVIRIKKRNKKRNAFIHEPNILPIEFSSLFVFKGDKVNSCPVESRSQVRAVYSDGSMLILGGMGIKYFGEAISLNLKNDSSIFKKHYLFKRVGYAIDHFENLAVIHGGERHASIRGLQILNSSFVIDIKTLKHQEILIKEGEQLPYLKQHTAFIMHSVMFLHGGITEENNFNEMIYTICLMTHKVSYFKIENQNDLCKGHTAVLITENPENKNFKRKFEKRDLKLFQMKYTIDQEFMDKYNQDKDTVNCKKEIYLFGGMGPEGNCNNEMRLLTYNKSRWKHETLNTMGKRPKARYNHQMTHIEKLNALALFGGRNEDNSKGKQEQILGDLWIFDLKSKYWIEIKNINGLPSRYDFAMTTQDNNIIVFGGFGEECLIDGHAWKLKLNHSHVKHFHAFFDDLYNILNKKHDLN